MTGRKPPKSVLFNRVCAVVWAVALIPAYLWWAESVLFVIVASIYANVKSDWGAAAAADDREVLGEVAELRREIRSLRDLVTSLVEQRP